MKNNTSLTFVGFRECRGVGDMGAIAIASALGVNSTLKKLNFESTKVGNRGASSLAQAILASSSCTLHRLDLAYCPIGDEGVVDLAQAIALVSCPLKVLHLDYCPQITDRGAGALLEALTSETMGGGITTIGLKGTSVSANLRAEIASALTLTSTRLKSKRDLKSNISQHISTKKLLISPLPDKSRNRSKLPMTTGEQLPSLAPHLLKPPPAPMVSLPIPRKKEVRASVAGVAIATNSDDIKNTCLSNMKKYHDRHDSHVPHATSYRRSQEHSLKNTPSHRSRSLPPLLNKLKDGQVHNSSHMPRLLSR